MWRCTNQRCAHTFMTNQDFRNSDNPDCPKCRQFSQCANPPSNKSPVFGVPGVLSAGTRGSDQALRGLAERYSLSDMGQRGGTRLGETAMQVQSRALETGHSVCSPTKSHLASKVTVPAGGPRFGGAKKSIPTQVVANHKG